MSKISNFLMAAYVVAFSAFGQTAFKAVTVSTNVGVLGAGALAPGVKLTLSGGVVSNSTAVNLTGSLTNVTIDGTHIADVKTAFAATLQALLTEASPGEAKLAYVLSDDSGAPGTRGVYRYDPTLATAADNVTIWQAQDAPAVGRWVRLAAGDNYQMSVDTLDDALAIEPAYLAASMNPTNSIKLTVKTRARKTLGKGGAGSYYYSATAPFGTNLGTIAAFGSGYLLWDGDGALTPQMFGALGDGTTDDTAAFQSAIDAAESTSLPVFVPGGTYRVSTLTLTSCEFYGVRNQQERVKTGNSIILQTASPTNHLIIFGTSGNAKPNVHSLTLVGIGDVGTPNKRAITAVSSRLVFSVSTNHAPTLANAPGYHKNVCFFYTSEDRYMGSAVVSSIATVGANCEVTLDAKYDNFATVAASGYLLDTSCKVVFSPVVTIGGSTFADPAAAGYAAIYISSGLSPRIADLTIAKFHTGIYVNSSTTPYLFLDGTIKINYSEFSGWAQPNPLRNTDVVGMGSVIVAGPYIRPTADLVSYPAETVVLTNSLARYTSFGLYNPWAGSRLADVRTDQCVNGYYNAREIGNSLGYALFDNVLRNGIDAPNGYFDALLWSGSSFGDTTIRLWFLSTNTTAAYFTDKAAVRVDGTTLANTIHFNTLAVPDTAAAPDQFQWAFDISGLAHSVSVGKKLGDLSGAATRYRATTYPVRWLNDFENTTPAQQVSGWYNPSGSMLAYSAAEQVPASFDANDVWLRQRLRIGTNAPVDTIHSVYGWTVGAGDGVNNIGYFLRHEASAIASGAGIGARVRYDVGAALAQTAPIAALVVMNNAGSGTAVRSSGLVVEEQTKGGTANANLVVGQGAATGVTGTWSIYNASTRANYFGGNIELGNTSDTTLARSAAGVVTIEGVTIAERPTTTALTYSGTNVTLTATSHVLHGSTLTLTNNCLLTVTSSDGAGGGITIVPDASTSYTVYLDSGIKLLGGTTSFVVTNSATETVNLEWKQTLRGGSSVILANKAVYP